MAAAEIGAILGRAGINERHALRYFAHDLGLAFQIKDDILDHAGITVGKVGVDETIHKKTKENFVILGNKNKGSNEKIIIGFIVLIILILIYFCFFHKKNIKQLSSIRNNYSRRIKLI
jgi:hypothetical protein